MNEIKYAGEFDVSTLDLYETPISKFIDFTKEDQEELYKYDNRDFSVKHSKEERDRNSYLTHLKTANYYKDEIVKADAFLSKYGESEDEILLEYIERANYIKSDRPTRAREQYARALTYNK